MKLASVSSLLMSALVLLGSTVHQTRADCTIKPLNMAYDGLSVDVYDGLDGVCLDPSSSGTLDYETFSYLTCNGDSCKIKVAGASDCAGTVTVACDKFIVFYLTDGTLNYCISSDEYCENSRRQLHQQLEQNEKRWLRSGSR